MTFSEYAGIAIVPTLSRLVLAAAFIAAGYNKVFKTAEFNAQDATTLKSMDVEVTPIKASTSAEPRFNAEGQAIVPVSFQQTPPTPSTATTAPVEKPAVPDTTGTSATTVPPHGVISNVLAPGQYSATAMYRIALMLHDRHWGLAPTVEKWLARIAAYTELVGGSMVLIGLFTRLWGLGLSIVMGMAFYMTSLQPLSTIHGLKDYFALAENQQAFPGIFIQLAFFVLAFGLMLTGAGPLSLDRLFFGGPRVPAAPPPPPPTERLMRYDRNA